MAEGSEQPASRLVWRSEDEFTLGDVAYSCREIDGRFASTAEHFCIRKPKRDVVRFERLLSRLEPRRIVELGIDEGGSTALIAQLADPDLLLGFDIGPEPAAGIERFITERGIGERVRVHWGVDQADARLLLELTRGALDSKPLDLVIDDASHLVGPTRASFEALFPLLRPGGTYLIEDWDWAHTVIEIRPGQQPLTAFVFELVAAAAHAPDLIASVEVAEGWVEVRRGDRRLEGDLRIRDLLGERARSLLPVEPSSRPGPAGSIRARVAAILNRT